MDKPLTQETQDALRAQARQIAVAHNMDADIQEELYGHFEDKALAYLSGDEAVTEADAVLLVKGHFGDPGRVKALLQEVHPVEASLSLLRRLAAVTILFALLSMFGSFTWSGGGYLVPLPLRSHPVWVWVMSFHSTTFFLAPILATGAMWMVLRRWQRRFEQGHPLWVYTMPTWRLGLVWTATMIVWHLWDALCEAPDPVTLEAYRALPGVVMVIFGSTIKACKAALWLWWCDQPPHSPLTLRRAGYAWLAFYAVQFMPHLASIAFDGRPVLPEQWLLRTATMMAAALLTLLLVLGGGYGLYYLTRRFSKTRAID